MQCVSTVTMSVQINGHRFSYFSPSRGIKQGDPLSLYLFLFCAEGFSHIIKHSNLQGLKAARHGPYVTRFLFADDSILFSKATKNEARAVKILLCQYSFIRGQTINYRKSSILISPNTTIAMKNSIASILGITIVDVHDKFFSLSSIIPRSKRQAFEFIKDRNVQKCAGWKEKLLSKGGKEVLIKSVSSAIPIYAKSCFRFPTSLCNQMKNIISQFWRGQKKEERKLH